MSAFNEHYPNYELMNSYADYEDEPDYDTDCKRAIHWAKTTLDQPFLILDTETTGFDQRILRQQCKLNNLAELNFNATCVMNYYFQYCGEWNDYHQNYTWQKLPGGDHPAIGYCRATLAVIKEMANG